MARASSFCVAVERVAFIGSEEGRHVGPVGGVLQSDGFHGRYRLLLPHAFELSYVGGQLHVIHVAHVAPSFHGFDVAAAVPIVFVDERERVAVPSVLG